MHDREADLVCVLGRRDHPVVVVIDLLVHAAEVVLVKAF